MRPLALALAAAALATAAPPAAAEPSLTLNGVAIDGVTNQRFENATVVIDAQGNVNIEAKGYAVRVAGEVPAARPPAAAEVPAVAGAPARLTRRYFLAAEHADPSGPQYDLAIFINAQWIREVKASEPQVVMEVTRYLRPGANRVVLAPTRRSPGERPASSREVALKVVIGEGNVGGDHVMIDNPLLEMTRTASDVEDRTEEHVLVAR
ncbi:hypothetical protein [Anaeromyxobacter terrae]|uniref:hypothetical protein n=1 Tax=Anaeromyxobacter terrae TaxID=2925406 RepID=UPI001F590B9D|nr:hypothetical protein [Anaeromyxobacter sp. SG22]